MCITIQCIVNWKLLPSVTNKLCWNTALLIVFEIVRKFPTFCITQRFINAHTHTYLMSLSSNRLIHSTLSHPISLRSISLLSSQFGLGVPSCLQVFPQHPVCIFLIPPVCHMPSLWYPFGHPNTIWWEEKKSWSYSLYSFLQPTVTVAYNSNMHW
jgi:hypothetical protein